MTATRTAVATRSRRSRPAHQAAVDDSDGGYFATVFVILLAVTMVACLSLLIDGGRITTARRHADLTAFQAARAAAQHLDPVAGRTGTLTISSDANTAADKTVTAMLARAGLDGRLTSFTVTANKVTVTVEITRTLTASALFGHPRVTVTGTGTARLGTGVTSEEPRP